MRQTINGKRYEVNLLTGLVIRYKMGFPVSVDQAEYDAVWKIAQQRRKNRGARKQAYKEAPTVEVTAPTDSAHHRGEYGCGVNDSTWAN